MYFPTLVESITINVHEFYTVSETSTETPRARLILYHRRHRRPVAGAQVRCAVASLESVRRAVRRRRTVLR